ncbi:MAG: ABC transporter substrate-binding protein [Patescibacteria group bacterium]
MNDNQSQSEFRLKRGIKIREYINQFSSTEKIIFGFFFVTAIVTALILATQVNRHFMINVPTYGGELREGIVGLPRTINPVIAVTDVDRDMSALVYAGLTKYSNSTIVPDIAQSWDISPDGLTYTFKLRTDVVFQDGKPLTADDVVFTIQKIQDLDVKSPRRADWMDVSVKEISPTEVQFILKQPYAPFLTNTTVGIIPKHIWGSVSDEQFIFSQYNIEPVGSGPYKLASIAHDNGGIPVEYHLTTWSKYYAKRPYIDTITLHFYADEEKALEALDSGAVDSLSSISPSEAARLASNTGESYKVLSSHLPRVFSVFFNQSQAPVLADATVRKALDMAVDRNSIVKTVLNGYGMPIHGPLPDSFGTTTITSDDSSITAAQQLLEKNGWKKNDSGIYEKKSKTGTVLLSFEISTGDSPDLKRAAESVKTSWTTLGAQVDVKVFESNDLYQNVIRARKYDALLFGQFIGKDRDLYAFWHSSQRNAPRLNVALYTNSKADKLLEQIRSTTDDALRANLYSQLYQIIHEDVPAVFLYVPDFIYVVPKKLQGVKLESVTVPADRWNSLPDWYINTDGVWKVFVK